MTPDEAQAMRADMRQLEGAVTRLSTLIETEGTRCPYREDIARSGNNRKQIEKNAADIERVETRVNALEISTAKLIVMMTGSGGLGGALVAMINYLATKGGA